MSKYPKVGDNWREKPQGLCKLCDKPRAEWRIAIEVDIFRGNDEVIKVHRRCLKSLANHEFLKRVYGNSN